MSFTICNEPILTPVYFPGVTTSNNISAIGAVTLSSPVSVSSLMQSLPVLYLSKDINNADIVCAMKDLSAGAFTITVVGVGTITAIALPTVNVIGGHPVHTVHRPR